MASILAIDDSLSMRQMVFFILKNDGHDVTRAEDGFAAVNIAKGKDFDLV